MAVSVSVRLVGAGWPEGVGSRVSPAFSRFYNCLRQCPESRRAGVLVSLENRYTRKGIGGSNPPLSVEFDYLLPSVRQYPIRFSFPYS